MDQNELFRRYQDYQSYVGWSATDEDHVWSAAGVLQPHLPSLIEDFCAEIGRRPEAGKILDGTPTTIVRVKRELLQWVQELLSGPYDLEYVARHLQVGRRLMEGGWEQAHVSAALARLRVGLVATLSRSWPEERKGLVPTILGLGKLLDLDLAIIEYAYQMEYLTRVRQNEQLAKVGCIAASVGHALRDPLNVVKTSIYYLRHATKPVPAKRAEHLQRMERNMEMAEQILLELSDLAAMPSPQLHPFSVGDCVDEALDQACLTDKIRVTKHIPAELPQALADMGQIRNVFVRLIQRTREGMHDGGQLSIRGRHSPHAVEVVFEDTVVHATKEGLAALEAPLSWSSVRVLGMNLAIVRAVLEANAGSLRAKHESGRGSTITVNLCPARPLAYK